MFELFIVIVFIWLMIKTVGLALKLTWGVTKIVASVLAVLALPLLIVCLLFAGGIILLIPVCLLAIAAAMMNVCIKR